MNDFSLLEFLGVDDGTKQLTKGEIEASERRAKQRFNEYQFQAHVEQERAHKQRIETSMTGRSVRCTHQEREHRHHHGNFWFAQGSIPSSHDNVGTTSTASGTILHNLDPSQAPLSSTGVDRDGGGAEDEQWGFDANNAGEQVPNMSAPKPAEIVIRPKLPPPPPKLSYGPANGPAAMSPHEQAMRQLQQEQHRRVASPARAPGTPMSQPRGHSPSVSFSQQQQRSATPTGSSRKNPSFVAPYAEHYDADALYDVDQPIRDFTLGGYQMDRKGIPRGSQGVDYEEGQAREAQRLGESMRRQNELLQKKDRQDLLKQQLDHLVSIKRDQRLQERELDNRAVYGYSLPGMDKDVAAARDRRKANRKELERVWQKQAAERELKRQAEEEYYRRPEEDFDAMYSQMDASRRATQETPAAVQTAAQQAWKGAWQEAQVAEGNMKINAEKERQRMEAQELKPHIANYSDRILLGEQVRKQQQEAYKRDLDEQIRNKQYQKGQQTVNNYRRDNQFHRPPFVTYGDGFH